MVRWSGIIIPASVKLFGALNSTFASKGVILISVLLDGRIGGRITKEKIDG